MNQIHQKSTKNTHLKDKCCICELRYKNARVNTCNHKFCFACINKWSYKKHNCPICRCEFSSIFTTQKICQNSLIRKQGRLKSNSSQLIYNNQFMPESNFLQPIYLFYGFQLFFIPNTVIMCEPIHFQQSNLQVQKQNYEEPSKK